MKNSTFIRASLFILFFLMMGINSIYSKNINTEKGNIKGFTMNSDPEDPPEGRSGFLFGIFGGVNASTRIYDYQLGTNPPQESFRYAPNAGILLGVQFSKVFSIESRWSYEGKGDRISMSKWISEFEFPPTINAVWEAETDGFITQSLHYGQVSLMPVLSFGNNTLFQIGAGVYAAYGFAGIEDKDFRIDYYLDYEHFKEIVVNEVREIDYTLSPLDISNESIITYNALDYGWCLYTGLGFNKINLGASLNIGMEDLEPEKFGIFTYAEREMISRNVTLSFTFTYLLNK